MHQLPDRFINWAFRERGKLVVRQANGEDVAAHEVFLGFTRHTPAVITSGPAGLNGSIKGVGFIPKEEFIREILDIYMQQIDSKKDDTYPKRGLEILKQHIWAPGKEDAIDFTKLGTLELAKAHTWENLRENPIATLLFYQPPMISFELRCEAEIFEDRIYHRFLNAQHDIYHGAHIELWQNRPAYIFTIKEIFDNSVGKSAFGKKIYPF